MGELWNTMSGYFEAAKWPMNVVQPEQTAVGHFAGNNGSWMVVSSVAESPPRFIFYCRSPMTCPPERLDVMADFLHRCNWGFSVGAFEVNREDGEVRFRIGANLDHCELTPEYLGQLIRQAVGLFDHALPGIMGVIVGGKSAQEAIDSLQNTPTPPQA
jgi:hypothetical protein